MNSDPTVPSPLEAGAPVAPPLPPLPQTVSEATAVARQSLRTEAKKLERLLGKLQVDRSKALDAPKLRLAADVLKVHLGRLPRGQHHLLLPVPWDPPAQVAIDIPAESTPLQEMERLYRRARGMELGLRLIDDRSDATQLRLWQIQELQQEWADLLARVTLWQAAKNKGESPGARARTWLDLAQEWIAKVRALRLPVGGEHVPSQLQRRITKAKGAELPKGVELHQSPSGAAVLVGRSAAANDSLVTRLLRGRDYWLHLRDQPGAHVVLRCDGPAPALEEDLHACAVLAAHLSGVAKGARVEVTVAQGKGVRKVKGAAPGSVYVSGERAVRVEVDAAVVDAFYARRPLKK